MLLVVRTDHVGVVLRRRVDVVVVVVEPGIGELLGLAFLQHAQRHATLKTKILHRFDHLDHAIEILVLRATPCGAHAETAGAFCLCSLGCIDHGIEFQQFFASLALVIACGLRTVAAVLGAAAGLYREQRRELHGIRVKVGAMNFLRTENQVGKGKLEQGGNRLRGPAQRRSRFGGARFDERNRSSA